MNKKTRIIVLYLKGLAMGAADIIPGVSGGTIALIAGIYEKLIEAISSVKLYHALDAARLLLFFYNPRIRESALRSLREIHWGFLITLILGILTSLLTMAKYMPWILNNYPYYAYSFFFGLILFSIQFPYRTIRHGAWEYILIIFFAALIFWLTGLRSVEGSYNLLYVFMCGTVAITAMILPGISGSYILVLLGEYKLMLEALHRMDFVVIAVFVLGIIIGILTFIRFLNYLLKKHHSLTMASLTGIMVGSLGSIWPLKFVKGPLPQMPGMLIIHGVLLALLGIFIIAALETLSRKMEK